MKYVSSTKSLIAAVALALSAMSVANAQTGASNADARVACEALAAARGVHAHLTGASAGQAEAFGSLTRSVESLSARLQSLPNPSQELQESSARLMRGASFFAGVREILVPARASLNALRTQPLELAELLDRLSTEELVSRSPAPRISAAQELRIMAERISRNATELGVPGNLSAERVFQLRKDVANFPDLAAGLLEGDSNMRLQRARSPTARKLLMEVSERFEPTRTSAGIVFRSLRELVAAQVTHAHMITTLNAVEEVLSPVCARATGQ
jgi:twitching motility protein PilJ